MKTKHTVDRIIKGVWQGFTVPDVGYCEELTNVKTDEEGGWRSDIGWEPLIPLDTTFSRKSSEMANELKPIRFLKIFTRHAGGETYYMTEKSGSLYYRYGNSGSDPKNGRVVLSSGRHEPDVNEPGCQYTAFGRFHFFINGHDAPIKFNGRTKVTNFGWHRNPATPDVLDMDTAANFGGYGEDSDYVKGDANAAPVRFKQGAILGLGTSAQGDDNSYQWRVSFISDTGSESPLSNVVGHAWTIPSDANLTFKYGGLIKELPLGPDNTVARRIYRTKNMKGGAVDNDTDSNGKFFFVDQINDNVTDNYIDAMPDVYLTIEAPSENDSTPIDSGYQYINTFDGRIFLAGGGNHPTKVIYSKRGLPEQFPAFNYFDVGVRDGGHITGLFPYYNTLLVFRENIIDQIYLDGRGRLTIGTLTQEVGTTATNTIKHVPGVGVCFLSSDGIYALTGGLQGGSSVQVRKISDPIQKELKRLTRYALPRSTATYSHKEKEYWVHYPADGAVENIRGVVLHTRNMQWSFRNSDEGKTAPMRFTHFDTDPAGNIVMGTYPQVSGTVPNSGGVPGFELQVWSATGSFGRIFTNGWDDATNTSFVHDSQTRGNSIWESQWEILGGDQRLAMKDDSKKFQVVGVEVKMTTAGQNAFILSGSTDYSNEWETYGYAIPQIPEVADTSKQQPFYGPNDETPVATYNGSQWQERKLTRLRWSVNTGKVSAFKFRIETPHPFHILSYQIHYLSSDVDVVESMEAKR